jgi:hypothetical protein
MKLALILTLVVASLTGAQPHTTTVHIPCTVSHPRCDLPLDGRWSN